MFKEKYWKSERWESVVVARLNYTFFQPFLLIEAGMSVGIRVSIQDF